MLFSRYQGLLRMVKCRSWKAQGHGKAVIPMILCVQGDNCAMRQLRQKCAIRLHPINITLSIKSWSYPSKPTTLLHEVIIPRGKVLFIGGCETHKNNQLRVALPPIFDNDSQRSVAKQQKHLICYRFTFRTFLSLTLVLVASLQIYLLVPTTQCKSLNKELQQTLVQEALSQV